MIACILLLTAFFTVSSGKGNRHGSGDDAQYIFCGGFANIQCPSEKQTCVDDPRDSCNSECGGADCGGICVILGTSSCGGFAGFSCPTSDSICIDNIADDCNSACGGADCIGTCATLPSSSNTETTSKPQTTKSNHNYQFCGGIANFACLDGYKCVDDPYDDCSTDCNGADCGGICVEQVENFHCGGFAGTACPNGYTCIDEDGDGCNALCGGADCGGICVKPLSADDDDETIYNCVRRCRKERSQCQNSTKGKQKNSSCLTAFKRCMQSCNP